MYGHDARPLGTGDGAAFQPRLSQPRVRQRGRLHIRVARATGHGRHHAGASRSASDASWKVRTIFFPRGSTVVLI